MNSYDYIMNSLNMALNAEKPNMDKKRRKNKITNMYLSVKSDIIKKINEYEYNGYQERSLQEQRISKN